MEKTNIGNRDRQTSRLLSYGGGNGEKRVVAWG